ncbi:MAG: LLM class flavin-dependent oxidoreductase [Acidimicrobiales bacterium]|nr:LLM class flavin-dependent oxidoreductase [Acidimicrobiales bacterium]
MAKVGVAIADVVDGGWTSLGSHAQALEECGVSAIWLTDHLFWHRPTVDVIGGLHTVAAATSECTIGPCVLQLPLRHSASTAKSMSYLDHVSGGRVTVGVGVGEHEAEYRAAGLGDVYHRRGKLLDQQIEELRQCWSNDLNDPNSSMSPARPLPLWVGGRSSAARRRAARTGDGWCPHIVREPWVRKQHQRLEADLAAEGRHRDEITFTPALAFAVENAVANEDPYEWFSQLFNLPTQVFEPNIVVGSPSQIAEEISAMFEAGADQVTFFPGTSQPAEHVARVIEALG